MVTRCLRLACALLCVAGFLVAPALAGDDAAGTLPVSAAENTGAWFVELSSPPAADGTPLDTLKGEKAAFRAAAKKDGVKFTERYSFDTLWNGLSVNIDPSQVDALSRIDGVKAVYPVVTVAMPDSMPGDSTADPELFTSKAMIGADIAQDELGLTGKGVRVAVMDTGLDYDNPDFGGSGVNGGTPFPTARVVTGFDFVGDSFNADSTSPAYQPVPHPDSNPDDCNGHGTHVAGIIGANGVVKGVAPDVTFGAYRVFGCDGSTTADVMIAAMERVLADKMDVLNMSIGSAFQTWPEYPTAAAADRLVNKGVSVVASIGNNGANGVYSAGAPGVGNKVIGVGAVDNTFVSQQAFSVSPDNKLFGYNVAGAAPVAPTSGTYPLAKTGTPTTPNDACNPLAAGTLTGKVVLIRRGACSFYMKARNAQLAGAAGVVLYNNVAGALNPTIAGSPAVTIPVVAITAAGGVEINGRIAAGPTTMTWTSQVASAPSSTGNLISSFSSYGLNAELTLKPDISAPGGNIWSTYPLELGGHTSMSGTSMAAPHVAGAVALLLQAHPNTPSNAIRSILQNTALPRLFSGNPALGLDNVHRQGAGIVQIDDAVQATTRIEPGKLSLGESEFGPVTRTLTLENDGSSDVTYDLSNVSAVATGGATNSPSFFTGNNSAVFSAPSVTVPAGGNASIDVTIAPAGSLPDKSQYGGYIVFTPQGGGEVYRVPYAGFKGDYQSIQVLTPTAAGLPWLARSAGANFIKQTNGATFTMKGADIPYFVAHFEHQARLLRIEVFDTSGKAWHRALNAGYLERNGTATAFFAFPIDGTTTAGNKTYTLPNGTYLLKVSLLKALGDESNPAHWETWTSPTFTVARP